MFLNKKIIPAQNGHPSKIIWALNVRGFFQSTIEIDITSKIGLKKKLSQGFGHGFGHRLTNNVMLQEALGLNKNSEEVSFDADSHKKLLSVADGFQLKGKNKNLFKAALCYTLAAISNDQATPEQKAEALYKLAELHRDGDLANNETDKKEAILFYCEEGLIQTLLMPPKLVMDNGIFRPQISDQVLNIIANIFNLYGNTLTSVQNVSYSGFMTHLKSFFETISDPENAIEGNQIQSSAGEIFIKNIQTNTSDTLGNLDQDLLRHWIDFIQKIIINLKMAKAEYEFKKDIVVTQKINLNILQVKLQQISFVQQQLLAYNPQVHQKYLDELTSQLSYPALVDKLSNFHNTPTHSRRSSSVLPRQSQSNRSSIPKSGDQSVSTSRKNQALISLLKFLTIERDLDDPQKTKIKLDLFKNNDFLCATLNSGPNLLDLKTHGFYELSMYDIEKLCHLTKVTTDEFHKKITEKQQRIEITKEDRANTAILLIELFTKKYDKEKKNKELKNIFGKLAIFYSLENLAYNRLSPTSEQEEEFAKKFTPSNDSSLQEFAKNLLSLFCDQPSFKPIKQLDQNLQLANHVAEPKEIYELMCGIKEFFALYSSLAEKSTLILKFIQDQPKNFGFSELIKSVCLELQQNPFANIEQSSNPIFKAIDHLNKQKFEIETKAKSRHKDKDSDNYKDKEYLEEIEQLNKEYCDCYLPKLNDILQQILKACYSEQNQRNFRALELYSLGYVTIQEYIVDGSLSLSEKQKESLHIKFLNKTNNLKTLEDVVAPMFQNPARSILLLKTILPKVIPNEQATPLVKIYQLYKDFSDRNEKLKQISLQYSFLTNLLPKEEKIALLKEYSGYLLEQFKSIDYSEYEDAHVDNVSPKAEVPIQANAGTSLSPSQVATSPPKQKLTSLSTKKETTMQTRDPIQETQELQQQIERLQQELAAKEASEKEFKSQLQKSIAIQEEQLKESIAAKEAHEKEFKLQLQAIQEQLKASIAIQEQLKAKLIKQQEDNTAVTQLKNTLVNQVMKLSRTNNELLDQLKKLTAEKEDQAKAHLSEKAILDQRIQDLDTTLEEWQQENETLKTDIANQARTHEEQTKAEKTEFHKKIEDLNTTLEEQKKDFDKKSTAQQEKNDTLEKEKGILRKENAFLTNTVNLLQKGLATPTKSAPLVVADKVEKTHWLTYVGWGLGIAIGIGLLASGVGAFVPTLGIAAFLLALGISKGIGIGLITSGGIIAIGSIIHTHFARKRDAQMNAHPLAKPRTSQNLESSSDEEKVFSSTAKQLSTEFGKPAVESLSDSLNDSGSDLAEKQRETSEYQEEMNTKNSKNSQIESADENRDDQQRRVSFT